MDEVGSVHIRGWISGPLTTENMQYIVKAQSDDGGMVVFQYEC